jgi:hypothetical protein
MGDLFRIHLQRFKKLRKVRRTNTLDAHPL